jgi:hypothetical protein
MIDFGREIMVNGGVQRSFHGGWPRARMTSEPIRIVDHRNQSR